MPPDNPKKMLEPGLDPENYPTLLSVDRSDDGKTVTIAFTSPKGHDRSAILNATDDVSEVLARWRRTGILYAPDREMLRNDAIEGFGSNGEGDETGDRPERKSAPKEIYDAEFEARVARLLEPPPPPRIRDTVTSADVQYYIALIVAVTLTSIGAIALI